MSTAAAAARLVRNAWPLLLAAGCAAPPAPPPPAPAGPRPSLAQGGLVVQGAASFPAERLLQEIAAERRAWSEEQTLTALDDAAWSLEEFYRAQGFPFASVDFATEPATGGGTRGRLLVDEGPRTRLAAVEIEGNTVLSDDELAALVGGPTTGVLGGERLFVEQELVDAAEAMVRAYRQRGHLRVRVAGPEVRFADDRSSASARFEIEEGLAFTVEEVALPEPLPPGLGDARALAPDVVGRPYRPAVAYELRARLLERLGRAGHADPRIEVQARLDDSTGAVVLDVAVDPGPTVVVGTVRIEGNERTSGALVRGLLALRAGEPWTLDKENDSFAALQESGLFESIRLELEGDGARRDLLVTVREAPHVELWLEPGYGSYEGPRLEAGIVDKNWLGRGLRLALEGSVSTKTRDTELSLLDRRFLGSRVSANLATFAGRSIEPSFTRRDKGASLTFARQDGDVRTSLGYRFRRTAISDVEAALAAGSEGAEDGDVGSIILSPVRDTRDGLFAPTRGSRTALVLEAADAALASEIEFLRASLQHDLFVPLREGTVLALSARTGVVVPAGDTDVVPISELWFNGGQDTVRSFREGELGPKDAEGDPLGGETFTVLSAELRQDVTDTLSGALFWDAGNVDPDHDRYLDFRDMRQGVGVGLRYMLPVGPVRLDVARNPDAIRDEDDWVVHLAVGMAF